jgi:nucleoside-diphosphate-sugar epimerase
VTKVFVTGGAGFIGSHICDRIQEMGHHVVCFDNLITGFMDNIEHLIGKEHFTFIKGDIRDRDAVRGGLEGCTHVCHQAALGSVPRSIEDPLRTNDINISGSLNVLVEAQRISIQRFVFASSSSVYGDNKEMPKVENKTGSVLSPYAVTKSAFEEYARVYHEIHGTRTIGLRYFNIFGPRQSPKGGYAAVIPLFMDSLSKGESPTIFGDGEQTRDFTYVQNAVDANILSLFGDVPSAFGRTFNVACGDTLSINRVYSEIYQSVKEKMEIDSIEPIHGPSRSGDIKDSLADLSEVGRCLGYSPKISFTEGIEETVGWFLRNLV